MYRQFHIQQFYILPTHCIYVFCVDLRTNSHYCPIQYQLTGFYNTDLTLYSRVVTICTASLTLSVLYSAHTLHLCVSCVSENKQTWFPYTILTDWFYNRDLTLYSPVITICTASIIFNNSTFCPHTVFVGFVWISEQTDIISLYNINWLVL